MLGEPQGTGENDRSVDPNVTIARDRQEPRESADHADRLAESEPGPQPQS
jgi:hypothetical protein